MLIIFDLDGTLTPQRNSSIACFEHALLPNVRETCKRLHDDGHTLAVATNQGGLRRGLDHRKVLTVLDWCVDELGIVVYRYASGDTPGRKKPAPGMLLELMSELGFDQAKTVFVGDAKTDETAAQNAGVHFVYAHKFFDQEREKRSTCIKFTNVKSTTHLPDAAPNQS